MNLTNLFNIKYLMQNIKKSKALIILLTLLVPMFTSIMLISIQNDSEYVSNFAELSIVNIIFMYVVPLVLSMTLFSYVYKKNSVDFIGSMPLSRKTIFITNTIGGIAIIAICQLLTAISMLFLSKVLSNIIIFGSMVWDIFIFFTFGYVFVFTVSNLAMSFSGNKFSQLVSTCLILFMIPFLIMSGDTLGDKNIYSAVEDMFISSSADNKVVRISEPYYFTAPNYIFDAMIDYNFEYEYSSISVIKMVILSGAYIVIGLIIFNKKKFELAGESYENTKIHLAVKLLTFIPFMMIFCSLNGSDKVNVFLFFVALLGVYYFVFDLITNKRIKIKLSIASFVMSFLIVFAVCDGIVLQLGKNNERVVKISDIQSIYIDTIRAGYNSDSKFGLEIKDKELIKTVMLDSYVGPISISQEVTTEEIKSTEVIKEPYKYRGSDATIIIKLKNGNELKTRRYLQESIYASIINTFGKECANVKVGINKIPCLYGNNLTNEERKALIEAINKDLENITYEELYANYNLRNEEYTLRFYEYNNHKLKVNNYSSVAFENLHQKVAEICNGKTRQLFDELNYFYINETDAIWKLIKENNPDLFNEISKNENEKIISEVFHRICEFSEEDIELIIKNSEKIDLSKEYIVIKSNYPTYYYTNNLQQIYEIMADNFNEISKYEFKLQNIF